MWIGRRMLIPVMLGVLLAGCTPASLPAPNPTTSSSTSAADPAARGLDYAELEKQIEEAVATGYSDDHVQAVLLSMGGQTKIAHYRHGFTATDHAPVFSVTKSVVSLLIGIAIGDGLITDADQTLDVLLPQHRRAMTEETGQITLREVMTMSAGFRTDITGGPLWEDAGRPGGSRVAEILRGRVAATGFAYADVSAHVAAAVLSAALERAGRSPSVLAYARERLFTPLGISTEPAWSEPLPSYDVFRGGFATAGFAWGTDPNGLVLGGAGLRLTAPDLVKLGELARANGRWGGKQILPAGWIAESTAPSKSNKEYAMLWRTIGPDPAGYWAAGYGGQWIVVLPAAEVVIAVLTEVPERGRIEDGGLGKLVELVDRTFSS